MPARVGRGWLQRDSLRELGALGVEQVVEVSSGPFANARLIFNIRDVAGAASSRSRIGWRMNKAMEQRLRALYVKFRRFASTCPKRCV